MKNLKSLKYANVTKDYFGHQGALYKGDKVIIKEITSRGIKVIDLVGKIYWLNSTDIKVI
tara:strand:- start:249 stop:428 length:180 start_codon:yes stop_codon:yes gene_type:complete